MHKFDSKTALTSTTDKVVAEKSMLIKNMIEDLGESALTTDVPIPNVSMTILVWASPLK